MVIIITFKMNNDKNPLLKDVCFCVKKGTYEFTYEQLFIKNNCSSKQLTSKTVIQKLH